MVELTDREKKIIYIKFIMHGHNFQSLPVETRQQMLKLTMELNKMKYDNDEMSDLGAAIINEQDKLLQRQAGMLHKYKDQIKNIDFSKFEF